MFQNLKTYYSFQIFFSIREFRGGRFSRFLRFLWFSTKKKSDPKCIDDPNNESGEQHWTKLKVYVLYYPLRRVPGRPKNFVRGGGRFSRNFAIFLSLSRKQKYNPKWIYNFNIEHKGPYWSKLKVCVVFYPLRRVSGHSKKICKYMF